MINDIKGKEGRENYILKLLSLKGSVRISELSSELQVSRETVRRDLKDMEEKGMLQYIHGGATIDTPNNEHYEATSAHNKHSKEKKAIGKTAADFVKDYEAIIIIGSTTTERIAPYLMGKNHITVITNSFRIAEHASENPTNSVIVLGGEYNTTLQATTGVATIAALENYRADKLFFSSRGVSCEFGITSHPETDALVIKKAMSISKTSILLGDHSKFWIVGLHKICNISDIDIVISDSNLPQKKINELSSQNIQVVIANLPQEIL